MRNNYESDDRMVSHPSHYISTKGLEAIDVIEAFTENLSGIEATDTGNVIKYICRWKDKNGLQDLKKAMWYLQHLINHVEEKQPEPESLSMDDLKAGVKERFIAWCNSELVYNNFDADQFGEILTEVFFDDTNKK